jgi:LmbE family N-acetylglucosaminyl deacetylase
MTIRVVILSPHLDDAVLSCWQLLTGPGDVKVINVFAGVPAAGCTSWWDRTSGATDSAQRMRERIEEDRVALRLAGRCATNLAFLDDQYRCSPPELSPIIEALRTELPVDAHVYAPAAVGTHPDHYAVREAALSMRDDVVKVSLYADLPHASARGWPPWVTNRARNAIEPGHHWVAELARTRIPLDDMRPTVHALSCSEHARKLAAVHAYATQLKPLETQFGRSIADQSLLGYEVEWELPRPGT